MPHIPGHVSPRNAPTPPKRPMGSLLSVAQGSESAEEQARILIQQLGELFQRNRAMPPNVEPMTRETQRNLLQDLFQRTMGALYEMSQPTNYPEMSGVSTPQAQPPVMNPQQFANFAQRSTPPKPGGQQLPTRQMAQQLPPNPGASPFDPNSPTFNRNAFQPQQLPPGY